MAVSRYLLVALLVACDPASIGPPPASPDLAAAPDLAVVPDGNATVCTGSPDCPKGTTEQGAPYDWICCGGLCADPHNDPRHCARCGVDCGELGRCRNLRCQ